MICVMFHWCSPKKWSQKYMLFRDGQRILGVISTMSVVHLFQMNFSYQPIKHRDEKPRNLSKALGIKAPHFRLTKRERHHRYPSRKIPRMRMLLSPKYGKHSRLPSNNKAATFRDKPSWCPTRCCWCKIDLRTGCSVWHQPSQDGMQGDPDLIGLVYVLHLHGTWNMYIYIYMYIYILIPGPQNQPSRALQFQLR